ncbi:hypothetical protein BH20VER2_BH20VER2_09600 [soil metagenome]|nr:outer membrane beta-barrel protein [Chthoniobacterales bacterium]
MKMINFSKLAPAAFALALLLAQPASVQAGGQGFGKSVLQGSSKEYAGDLGTGKFESFPFHVSVTVRGGYDDNPNLLPFDSDGSWFTNAAVGLTYEFGSPRTRLSLNAGAGVTYYFDRSDGFDDGDFSDYDVNAYLGFNITHKATPRLTLAATLYAAYQSQPDFTTFNASTISIGRQSQDFFFSTNRFSAGYAWAPRFSTVTSYTLGIVDYDDALISLFQDRFEHTIGNEFRFLVWPTTTLVAEYRFGIVDYMDDFQRDSTSHFLLGGFDHSFSPRLNMSARAGVEFRSFDGDRFFNQEADRTHPYFEATVNYAVAQSTAISWTNRYSLEQPDVPDASSRSTYRSAISVRHAFTPRIIAGLNVAYQHDSNEGAFGVGDFEEDAFDISLSVRYAMTRNLSFDAGYHHTQVISDEALFREFSRNRYYIGATFTF